MAAAAINQLERKGDNNNHMVMTPGNLLAFTKGGGGLIGKGKVCRLDDFKIVTHALKAKDGTLYPVKCFVQYDINVLDDNVEPDKRHAVQYLQVGRVPLWYATSVNSIDPQRDPNYPGGYLPSTDNQNPTTEGPFILFIDENGIWEGEDYSVFLQEFVTLGFLDQGGADRMAKSGIACLSGVVVKLDEKAKKKGAKSDPNKAARTVMVPVQIIKWPWAQAQGVPVAAAATSPIVPPSQTTINVAPIAPPAIAAPAIAPPAAAGANASGAPAFDTQAIDLIKTVVKAAGGMLPSSNLLQAAFPATSSLEGTVRSEVMRRVNTPDFVKAAAAAGHFLLDAAGTLMVTG